MVLWGSRMGLWCIGMGRAGEGVGWLGGRGAGDIRRVYIWLGNWLEVEQDLRPGDHFASGLWVGLWVSRMWLLCHVPMSLGWYVNRLSGGARWAKNGASRWERYVPSAVALSTYGLGLWPRSG